LRDYYELLVACRGQDALAGIGPSRSIEGGFAIPRTEAGWHQMLRSNVAPVRVPFAELTEDVCASIVPELRFGLGCGSLRWSATEACGAAGHTSPVEDLWIDLMPRDKNFETDTLASLVAEEHLVRIWAYNHVEDRQLQAFVSVLRACGHSVQQTTGFRVSHNASTEMLFCLTGTRAATVRHKAGKNRNAPFALCAPEVSDGDSPKPRFTILGPSTTKDSRPLPPRCGTRGAKRLRALLQDPPAALMDATLLSPTSTLALMDGSTLSPASDKNGCSVQSGSSSDGSSHQKRRKA